MALQAAWRCLTCGAEGSIPTQSHYYVRVEEEHGRLSPDCPGNFVTEIGSPHIFLRHRARTVEEQERSDGD